MDIKIIFRPPQKKRKSEESTSSEEESGSEENSAQEGKDEDYALEDTEALALKLLG